MLIENRMVVFLKKLTAFFLVLLMMIEFSCAFAENTTAYEELMSKDPGLITRFAEAGLESEMLISFISAMSDEVNTLLTPEARETIEAYFIIFLVNLMTTDEYIYVQIILDESFPNEIEYMLKNMRVPPEFEALFLILMEDKISESAPPSNAHLMSGGGHNGTDIFFEENPTPTPEEIVNEPEETPLFSDLENHEWAKFYIKELYDKKVLNGYEDGTFRPDTDISRSEIIKLITTLLLDKTYKNNKSEYTDVVANNWFYDYLITAEYFCIIKDIYKGEFKPNEKVTRQELAAITYRAILRTDIKLPLISIPCEFVDFYQFAGYAHDPIRELQKAGVISGIGDNKFAPLVTTTRAEVAKIIYIVSTFKQ